MIIISLPVVINAAVSTHTSDHQQQHHQQQHHQQGTYHLQQYSTYASPSPLSQPPPYERDQLHAQQSSDVDGNHIQTDYQGPASQIVLPSILSVPSLCKVTLCAKMYSSMSSINWMFIEGLLLHSRLTTSIFRKDAPFPLYYAIGWVQESKSATSSDLYVDRDVAIEIVRVSSNKVYL
ncbi:corticotropin-releasing factor receptor 2-like [Tropilaelaps mercedesae]|uniref:Corticotropin-releasing factor receptor 2-like n=1 Tax=Tropilaelaps mercedesae TaxID=418985 RepID=A0A1V9XVW0_9ACAR|nr:corticotropin-releasing factor receptor 2-like [Tropilaelaps mercedesae]